MRIFIDSDFKCHVQNEGTMREFEVPFFDGKCDAFVEGYRYVPEGDMWVLPNGKYICGEMIAPWVNYDILEIAQQTADRAQEQADEQIMELLDVIEELIIGG